MADEQRAEHDVSVKQLGARRPGRSLEAAAVAGMAYSVLAVSGLVLLSRFPDLGMSDEELTRWFDDSGRRAEVIVGLNLVSISAIAFLWFVAVIRRRLGDREDRFFGTVFFGSSIAYVGVWVVAAAVIAAPAIVSTLFDDDPFPVIRSRSQSASGRR